jgi:hypothetical protein
VPIGLIRVYQWTLAPIVGGQCRFHPTCSWYGLEAYRTHGLWRGTVLTARRLSRCHPFSRGGYDPVPPPSDAGRPEPPRTDAAPGGPVREDARPTGGAARAD